MPRVNFILAAFLAAIAAPRAQAIIVLGQRVTLSASDYLAGGIAQYQGGFGGVMATAVGPRHILTAFHVADGSGGGQFHYRDGTATLRVYQTTYAGRRDDLAIWKLVETEPSFRRWAPLYTRSNEVGQPLRAFGNGAMKGAEVRMPQTTGELRGWAWGGWDGQQGHGTNVVAEVLDLTGQVPGGFEGDYLYFSFDAGMPDTECIYSTGDSGGAIFITDPVDGTYKLAGINSLVDGGWSYLEAGPYFNAGLFDARSFWNGHEGNHVFVPDEGVPVPAGSYATRISSRAGWILSVVTFCGSADFNRDGDSGTDADIEAFFACLAGNCCPTCDSADFNYDGDTGTDADIEAFFRVLAGGAC
jgi:hypothetical protein